MEGLNISHSEYDVIDLRIHEVYSSPGGSGNYFNKINKFGRDSFTSKDNASSFYCQLGLNPEIRIKSFDYERDIEKEEELYTSLNLPSKYSVDKPRILVVISSKLAPQLLDNINGPFAEEAIDSPQIDRMIEEYVGVYVEDNVISGIMDELDTMESEYQYHILFLIQWFLYKGN